MKKIVVGVDQAAGLHSDNVMVTALCGVLRGAGTSIMRPLVTTMASSETVSQVTSDSVAPGVTCDNVQVTSGEPQENKKRPHRATGGATQFSIDELLR